jgi:NAD(P)-dependent dehydrogenase (short-subunit alcohol dehydrogenase family)
VAGHPGGGARDARGRRRARRQHLLDGGAHGRPRLRALRGTRAAARELGPDGITVNAVAPGLVSDEATRTLNTDDYIATAARGRALGREMVPDDLVGAVLFLASAAGGFVTGQTLVVDGGGVFT